MAIVAEPSSTDYSEGLRSRQQSLKRVLAVALIAVGLLQWAAIVGLMPIAHVPFSEAGSAWQWATVNLAAAYLVAAVGLWLLTSWGLVIWVYAVGCEVAMSTVFAGTFGFRVLPLLVQFALLGAYIASAVALRRAEEGDQLAARRDRLAAQADHPVATGRYSQTAKLRIAQRLKPRGDDVSDTVGNGRRVRRAG